ncbi:MAG TPA: hypothetical protein VG942_08400, partial [Hyphomonadaceae bacterium]|nr:hypothetical protein [Hyphomonadaceae bacterium]
TVGGGYEWSFADHWSVKFEYLYIDFGSQSGGTLFSAGGGPVVYDNLKDNIVRIGLNYRIW